MARKVEDAAGKLKKRRERKGMWDEVNGSANKFDKLKDLVADEPDGGDKDEWEDMEEVDDGTADVKNVESLPADADTELVVVDRTAHPPVPETTHEDEADQIT